MAELAHQQVQITGTEIAYAAAAAGGDTVKPGDRVFLHVVNGDVSDHTVTLAVPGTEYGQAKPDVAVTVTAGEERMIGPLPRQLANSNGLVDITYDAVTSLTIAAVRI